MGARTCNTMSMGRVTALEGGTTEFKVVLVLMGFGVWLLLGALQVDSCMNSLAASCASTRELELSAFVPREQILPVTSLALTLVSAGLLIPGRVWGHCCPSKDLTTTLLH